MARRHAPVAARAMTLLEVVLAVLLLALVATAVLTVISSINMMEANNRRQAAAYEVANRVILQYFDDADAMADKSLPIRYGDESRGYYFFYDLAELGATMEINRRQASGTGANLNALGRYRLVGVTISDGIEVGNGVVVRGEPIASLSRLMDPATARNPDTLATFEGNHDKIGEMIRKSILGGAEIPNFPTGPNQGPR